MELGWIDFSQEDKRKALNILAMLRESGAVDELGLGVIRDAFANFFFPGTSTIQTRAKYFIIMNNILDDFSFQRLSEKKTIPSIDTLLRDFRTEEFECAKALVDHYKNKDKKEIGIIGSDEEYIGPNKQEKWIKRTPSVIYWNGLKTYGILGNKDENILSIKNYLTKSVFKANMKKKSAKKLGRLASKNDDDECESDNYFDELQPIHSPCEYGKTEKWIKELSLQLTKKESEFLRRRIVLSVPESLIALILRNNFQISYSVEKNIETESDLDFIKAFPHVFESFTEILLNSDIKIDNKMKYCLKLAVEFNKLATLARIRYNLILSNHKNKKYLSYWNEYSKYASTIPNNLIEEIYLQLPIKVTGTKAFLEQFLKAFKNNNAKEMDNLVEKQEIFLKQKVRSKLYNREKYYNSEKPSWIGGKELDFRLKITKDIVRDIYDFKD